jgi:chromosome partitioning protein
VKTIAVLNQKGGVGKTTTAVNVAAYLASKGNKVLIVDIDPQGNATSGLGLDKQSLRGTTYDLLTKKTEIQSVISETNIPNLWIVGSNTDLAAAEVELVNEISRESILANSMQQLAYDYVFIDCPPSLGLLTLNALCASDYLLIPVQTEYYALEGLGQLLAIFQRVKQSLNNKIELLGVVATMYDSRNSLAEQVYSELEKHFGDKVFDTKIPRNVRLAEAPSYGKPIQEHDRWSKGARAYKQLSKELAKRLGT